MIDLNTKSEILNKLTAGVAADEIARDFTDTLNAALAEQKQAARELEFMEKVGSLVDEINVVLLDYCELHGAQNSNGKFFTTDELIAAFKAKIEGPDTTCKCARSPDPDKVIKSNTPNLDLIVERAVDDALSNIKEEDWNKVLAFLNGIFGN
jgi:hypothetical protein